MGSLADYYVPIAAWVKDRLLAGTLTSPTEVEAEISSRIERARRATQEDGIEEKLFEAGLFPVVVWIDESLMCSDWPGAKEWRSMLLQKTHFNIVNGGVEFFRRLNALGPEPADREILAVYYMALHLGFQGQYGMKGGEQSAVLVRQRLQNLLEPIRLSEGASLFPGVLPASMALSDAGSYVRSRNRRLKTLLLWGTPPGILLILFAVFDRIVHRMVQNVLIHLY
jgi:type VI secretion system protein ImpK